MRRLLVTAPRSDATVPLGIIAAGGVIAWLCRDFPAAMPVWAPWEFSWPEFLAAALGLWWYARGVRLIPTTERPAIARSLAFVAGVALIYAVLQTHFDYAAQHMFFLNRLQHLAMHHLGPFLIALGWPGASIRRGMPGSFHRMLDNKRLVRAVRILQHPVIAGVLFVGLIDLWLIPAVHFQAMIDHRLYALMNWSMVADGLLFWCLVLDPRPSPPARVSFGMRMITTVLVMFPQIMLGSYLTFTTYDLYTFYDLCGRLYPTISALNDQHIGGIIVWIPASMMSSAAFMLTLNHIRVQEDSVPLEAMTEQERRIAAMARSWTGR
jgi:putative membrane protein